METASIVVLETTSDDLQCLEALATELVEKRLVACAQILGPHQSFYRWEGSLVVSQEHKLQLKTTPVHAESVWDFIGERHNYELPERVRFSWEVSREYAEWVQQETSAAGRR